MNITPKQQIIINEMIRTYGLPEKLLISDWDKIVRMDWCKDKRHLFIDQDGQRVVWHELVI